VGDRWRIFGGDHRGEHVPGYDLEKRAINRESQTGLP
jgi:hypothetical protein